MATAFRRAALAALERPLASNDRLANWLDATLDHLKGFFRVFDIRFEGSPYDMPGRMGPAIREALLGAKVPAAARRFLTNYLEQGLDGVPFSTAAKEFRAAARSPERDFTELVRIFDIRQSQRQSLTEYLDDFTALTTPVAGYRLPTEVQGILFLRSLADDIVRQMTLRLMAETGDSPLGTRLELAHVASIAGRAELMVPALSFSRPGHSRSPTTRGTTQRQPRGRDSNYNRGHRAGQSTGPRVAPTVTGANATTAGGIRRCYKCRRIGHDADSCRTVVASLSADRAFRALLDSGRSAIFIVEGTLANVPARILLDSGAGLNLIASRLADRLPAGTVERLSDSEVAHLADAAGRPMGSVTLVAAHQPIVVHEFETLLSFGVCDTMAAGAYDVILGAPFFRAHGVNIDYEQNVATARGWSLGELLPLTVSLCDIGLCDPCLCGPTLCETERSV
jgi:hypothetical protein